MPLFETAIPIDQQEVAQVVLKNWNIKLGKILKASQNHTFEAFSQDDKQKYSVRVTPDPEHQHLKRIEDEIFFVNYCIKANLQHLVRPIPPQTQPEDKLVLVHGKLIIVVFEWAKGSALDFMAFRWMRDLKVVRAWGKFFAQMHKISRHFEKDHTEIAQMIQNWDKVHCGILEGVKLHPDDVAVINDPQHFGVIHGDLNCSNTYYYDDKNCLSVYDTDQVQRGFYLFDVAQAMVVMPMLEQGGLPVVGTPVEGGVNTKEFIDAMVEGYESQGQKVDRDRLMRMLQIKKQLYVRFATRAFKEGNIPKDMEPFLKHILDKFADKWKAPE